MSPLSRNRSSHSRSKLEAELQEAKENRDWDRVHELSERLASSTRRSSSTSRSSRKHRERHDFDDVDLNRPARTHFRQSNDSSSSSSDDSLNVGESLLSGLFTGLGVAAGASIFGSLTTPRYECSTFSAPMVRTRTVYRPVHRFWT
ncbi:hypothetical protein V865_004272 [Kwoniella europaea PYCC6329]|uniref:Uncharacterized protein n=1 Tax=Kwoniella europaea PYCC6329 TaxID=1423913 RepID=A0AAX4KKB4_9TREE